MNGEINLMITSLNEIQNQGDLRNAPLSPLSPLSPLRTFPMLGNRLSEAGACSGKRIAHLLLQFGEPYAAGARIGTNLSLLDEQIKARRHPGAKREAVVSLKRPFLRSQANFRLEEFHDLRLNRIKERALSTSTPSET